MRIMLTGSSGYLGKEFIKKYGNLYDIVEYDLNNGEDILDYTLLEKKMAGCEQVVHLAAIPKPVEGKSFQEYFDVNVKGTLNVAQAALKKGLKRIVYASSTAIYGIERGIPFKRPIKENQAFVSQYLSADKLSCRDIDLSYHASKVMAEQILAWFGLNKKIQTIALRFGPINKVFLGTSISTNNATQAISLSLQYQKEAWYEAFSVTDEIKHIDLSKAKKVLGYKPEKTNYSKEQIHSLLP
ncbi:MAG: NAD(P)-dependent oxidoreductase [Candidatus ainarchaeum sp.]|nr:NAD(P)-dependent oxidoreductase [Candidatus ainarchaeum sp.]